MHLSAQNIAAFSDLTRARWAEEAAYELHATWQDHYSALSVTADMLIPLCARVERFAGRHDIKGAREVFRLALVAASMGHRFWQDPRFHPYVASSVGNVDLVPSRRATAMADHCKAWLQLFWNGDTAADFGTRLAHALRAGHGPAAISQVLPQHWRIYSHDENQRLTDWLRGSLDQGHLPGAEQQLAYLALALIHGVHWIDDPQYTLLAKTITDAADGRQLADQLSAIYAAMA